MATYTQSSSLVLVAAPATKKRQRTLDEYFITSKRPKTVRVKQTLTEYFAEEIARDTLSPSLGPIDFTTWKTTKRQTNYKNYSNNNKGKTVSNNQKASAWHKKTHNVNNKTLTW